MKATPVMLHSRLKRLAEQLGGELRVTGDYPAWEYRADSPLRERMVELFRELWTGEPVRLLGIRTSKLAEEGEPEQMTLFEFQADQEKEEKRERLNEALGKIRKKYGENVIQKGVLPENDRESR